MLKTLVALLGATGVILGALGAHKLGSDIDASRLSALDTASKYHLAHAVMAYVAAVNHHRLSQLASSLFLLGILLFCGSLYAIAFLDLAVGPVVPFGGTAFILAWLTLALSVWRGQKDHP